MLDGPTITKQLASSSEKHQLTALLNVSNYLNSTDAKDLPLMLVPALETMLRGGDMPTKHRVLMYGMARRSSALHSALLAAICSDLEDTTVNDPACLSAAASSLPMLPIALILNFFARPGNEDGAYSCEESAEVINRCFGHEDARVRCGTAPGLTKAAIRAYGALHGTEGLELSSRAHESWAAAVRFRDVVHDHVGELLNKLSNLVAEDSDERVVSVAAASLHNTMKGAALVGKIRHEGDECWDLDGTNFLLVDVMRGIDERASIGGEWAHFTVQAARALFDLTQKVLGAKETKLNQLVQRTLQSSPGSFSHPALLRFGSDLVLLRLYLTSRPQYHPKTAEAAALHWAGTMLAREACGDNSLWEDALVGNSELLRLLHLPCLRHIRGLLANSVFETSMSVTRGAISTTTKKELDVAYRPQLYHHIATELLSSEDISLVACAITALPWCCEKHLLPSRFARCLRLICLIEELPVRCGLLSALTATLMTDPTSGVRPASSISAALGTSQTLDILQDRAPRKLSSELDTAQLRHELACALLKGCAHSLTTGPARPVVFRVDALSTTRELFECLRWAEAASVLLTQEFRGWKLSECLSWACTDMESGSEALFPSAAAPLSFVKLLALVLTACNRAKLVKFETAPHMSVNDEAVVRSQITSLEESIDALQTRDTDAKSAGELEISEALQSTLSAQELKRNELLVNLRSPKEQWTTGWASVCEDMSKLSQDLVVWTLGRGIKDRGVRVSLLALLADQWSMLTEKRESTLDTVSGTPGRVAVSQGREGTPESHGTKWDTDSFGRSHSAGRSDQSMSQGGSSFEECDDMSFSESALSEDLAREIVSELSKMEPSIKYMSNQEEDSTSTGLIGGGSCLRAVAPPSAHSAYHEALVVAALRLADTCPQTAPVFLSAFTSRISSAKCAHRVASEVAPTLAGFQDTSSELEPLALLLSSACSKLLVKFPNLVHEDPSHNPDTDNSHPAVDKSSEVAVDQSLDAFSAAPPVDFFAAANSGHSNPPSVETNASASIYITPPRPTSSSETLPQSTHSLELIEFVLSICNRGFAFGDRFWHSKTDPYGSKLVAIFENQFSRRGEIPSEVNPLLSKTVGGCSDPLVGNLSVLVSTEGLVVQLVLTNTTACSLVGVGGRISGGGPYSVDTLPSGASVRFQWDLALTVKKLTAQVFFRSLELEANSDSEEEVEVDGFGGDDEVDDFVGDDFGGEGEGGESVPSLVRCFLPPISLQVSASSLLTGANLSPDSFLATWPHLPYSNHIHGVATDENSISALAKLHRTAFIPSISNSRSIKIHSYAWLHGKVVVGAVLSAVLCENREVREALDILDEVRTKLNIDPAVPHNDALLEAVRITGVHHSSDADLLVRRVATALKLNTYVYNHARWVVDIEMRCDNEAFLAELGQNNGSDWLMFLGRGALGIYQKVPITLAKETREAPTIKTSMIPAWRKLMEERERKGYLMG